MENDKTNSNDMQHKKFSFFCMPKSLITDERLRYLSSDAKILYGLMLDRMSLSMSNGWVDKENRVYIIYTAEQIMQDMNCSSGTCTKILSELDTKKGIGLIERHKRGLGKPDIIYVNDFDLENSNSNQVDENIEEKNVFIEEENINIEFSEIPETKNVNVQRHKKYISREIKNEIQKSQKMGANNTNINNTDIGIYNPIYLINQEKNEIQLKENISKIPPCKENLDKNENNLPNMYTEQNEYKQTKFKNNKMDRTQSCQNIAETEKANGYMQIIRENIEYDIYMQDSDNQEAFDEIYNLMCDVVTAKCASIRVGGVYYPHELVKARFLKLNSQHILYVIHAMKNVQDKIHNIRSYLITALYNAPSTMKHYYSNAVNADYGIS